MVTERNPLSFRWFLVRHLTGGQIEAVATQRVAAGQVMIVRIGRMGGRNTAAPKARGWMR